MSHNVSFSLFSLISLLVFTTTMVTAGNITQAFQKYSHFSTMSDIFIKTKLTLLMNKYQTLTILALDNKAISAITNRSDIEVKNILMNHVILDYYDELKLKGLKEKSIMLTSLYQTTGLGEEMNGFINLTKSNGRVFFGSEVKDSPIDAEYLMTLYHNPFNLSIIQISMPIVAPGLSIAVFPPPPPPAPLAPAPSPRDNSPAPAPSPIDGETGSGSDGDYSSDPIPASETSEVDSPSPAPSAADEKIEAADKARPPSSACKAGLSIVIVLLLSFFAGF